MESVNWDYVQEGRPGDGWVVATRIGKGVLTAMSGQ